MNERVISDGICISFHLTHTVYKPNVKQKNVYVNFLKTIVIFSVYERYIGERMNMKQDIFEEVYRKYQHGLYLFALSLTHHPQDAEDLVEETFLKAYLSYNGKMNIHAWLFKVLKNLFIDEYRKKKKYIHTEENFIENIIDPSIELNKIFHEKEEKRQWMYKKIYQSDPLERNCMILTMTSGMKDQEIAEILQITPEYLRVIRHRVKEKLKKEAEKEFGDE